MVGELDRFLFDSAGLDGGACWRLGWVGIVGEDVSSEGKESSDGVGSGDRDVLFLRNMVVEIYLEVESVDGAIPKPPLSNRGLSKRCCTCALADTKEASPRSNEQ